MSFEIDPGTVPPLTGPGVVAGWYRIQPDGTTLLVLLFEAGTTSPILRAQAYQTGAVWTAGMLGPSSPDLRTAWQRLRRRLDSFHTAYKLRTHPQPLTDQTLRTWLRELNLHEMETT